MLDYSSLALCLALSLTAYSFVKSIVARIQRRKFAKAHGCLPPQNQALGGDPIIGISLMLDSRRRAQKSEYMQSTKETFDQWGNTYVNNRLLYTTVNTCDPEIVKEVLATKFEDFETAGIRVKALTPLFGKGIFVTDGPQWAHCRAILRPILSRQSLDALLPRLEVHVQNLLPHIPKDGQTFDLQALTSQFTMDVAVEYLTGRSTGMLVGASGPDRSFADDYMEACVEAVKVLHLGPLHKFSFKSGTPARDRSWAYVDRYVDEVLEIRRKIKDVEKNPELDMDNDRNNFIRQLANNSDSPEMLRSHILNTLLASRDTTAALLGNLFFELARRPEIYAKLRAEAFNQLGGRLPIEDDFKNMPYLRNCINEALRLYPSIPLNGRSAARDTVFSTGGGKDGKSPLFVAKGTHVVMSTYAMHRREDLFGPDPETYVPERWETISPPSYAYIPFNGGPRLCIGQQFALVEAYYFVTRMAQSFAQLEARDDQPWTEFYAIALFSKNGAKMAVRRS